MGQMELQTYKIDSLLEQEVVMLLEQLVVVQMQP